MKKVLGILVLLTLGAFVGGAVVTKGAHDSVVDAQHQNASFTKAAEEKAQAAIRATQQAAQEAAANAAAITKYECAVQGAYYGNLPAAARKALDAQYAALPGVAKKTLAPSGCPQ